MDTPSTTHFSERDYEHIYPPSEDSFLLLDALESDLDYLKKLNPTVCAEIGSGSGIIITALAKSLTKSIFVASDINAFACIATKKTATANSTFVDTIKCNLLDGIKSSIVDLLIFNPPYVPTAEEEHNGRQLILSEESQSPELIHAWSGGQHGRVVIDEILLKLNDLLSCFGVFYLLVLRENKPEEIVARLIELNFHADIIQERRIPGEYLYIIKATRNQKIV